MIDITFQPTQLVIDQISSLSIKLTNSGNKPCTHINFRLRLPTQIVLLEGTDKIDNAKIDPGQNIIHTVRVRPKQVGSWFIRSSSFSYRDSQGQSQHPSPLQYEVKVIPMILPTESREPKTIEVGYADEIDQSMRDNQLTSVQDMKHHELTKVQSCSIQFDVFLCHNSSDKPTVRHLAEELKSRGIVVWLDEWELVPGRPWQEALEEVIQTVRSAAVLVGVDGFGPWQDREMRGFLSEFVRRNLPVIPVLLPGAPEKPELPIFLKEFTWVDLRSGISKIGLDRLLWGITGKKPIG
jgi:hypothetical protein